MTATTTRNGVFTYDDFCTLVGDGQKGDLIDGVIYVASPENIDANELFAWLLTVMNIYVQRKNLGKIFGSRVACRFDDKNAPEPDIVFVSNARKSQLKRGGIEGPPDLAIEIVSPESVERDYEKKRKQYEKFGVSEYWIIDEDDQKVTALRLDAKGKYREKVVRKGVLKSTAIAGFWLEVAWLWQDPLPDALELLQRLLDENGNEKGK